MKISRLSVENRYEFADMDPLMYLDVLNFPGVFVLVAIDEETSDKLGILICRNAEKELIISWIYVAPEYRNRGVGEKLIETVFETAAARQYIYVSAIIPAKKVDGVFRNPAPYFSDKLFNESPSGRFTWSSTLDTLSGNSIVNTDFSGLPYRSFAFSDMSKNELQTSLKFISAKTPDYILFTPDYTIATADPDISTVIVRDGKPCGILTFSCIHTDTYEFHGDETVTIPAYSTLYTTLFSVLDKSCGAMLLSTAIRRAMSKYSPNTVIRVLSFHPEVSPAWNALFPDMGRESRFWRADVEEYLAYRALVREASEADEDALLQMYLTQ